jgi:transcriptional regulator
MYSPKAYQVSARLALTEFLEQHSFGVLFSMVEGAPYATHLPLLFQEESDGPGFLIGHMAKANPHWRAAEGQEVLAVFQGPHAFIPSNAASPEEPMVVPTWNYVAVHVKGRFERLERREHILQGIRRSVQYYEPHSPLLARLNEPSVFKLLDAIVGFKIVVSSMEGKWKLSQNHSPERRRTVIDLLMQSSDPVAVRIARLMESTLSRDF